MQVDDLSIDRLRRLAELHVQGGKVLSVYLDLDPSQFGTQPARASAIRSLLDDADRRVREADGLGHDEQAALRRDVARLEAFFEEDFSAKRAHALAVFASTPADLFEVVRLPRPAESQVVIDDSPYVEPLVRMWTPDRWAVAVLSRSGGRILRGSADRLTEVRDLGDRVHGQHQQGGWSQARYQRSVDQDAGEHLERVLDALHDELRLRPFDRLVIAAGDDVKAFVDSHLHPAVQERLAGRIERNLEEASVEEIHAAARPVVEQAEREHERELLDRLTEGVGTDGRAAAGLEAVLDALVQRRVEALLLADGFRAAGSVCPRCGWMGPAGERCPVDGGPVDQREDVVESAVESALLQSAEVMFVREHEDLGPLGGIGAVLRF